MSSSYVNVNPFPVPTFGPVLSFLRNQPDFELPDGSIQNLAARMQEPEQIKNLLWPFDEKKWFQGVSDSSKSDSNINPYHMAFQNTLDEGKISAEYDTIGSVTECTVLFWKAIGRDTFYKAKPAPNCLDQIDLNIYNTYSTRASCIDRTRMPLTELPTLIRRNIFPIQNTL